MLTVKPLSEYFDNHSINASINTLGHNGELVDLYVRETQDIVDKSVSKHSHHVKFECYNRFYTFDKREKFTGFEGFKEQDGSFRAEMSSVISTPQFSSTRIVDRHNGISLLDYKTELGYFLSDIKLPKLLYLSGGIDSELVARVLIDNNIEFTPIIFQWTNNKGQIKNFFDINYAFKFCEKYGIKPIVRSVNIESLWQSQEFKDLAIETQYTSPQVNTYVHIINLMNKEMPGYYHMMGGEIRYRTGFLKEDNTVANLVQSAKVTPGYGTVVRSLNDGSGRIVNISLHYHADGTWIIQGTNPAGVSGTPIPITGTWAVPPMAPGGYEWRIAAMSVIDQQGEAGQNPVGPNGTWVSIPEGSEPILNAWTSLSNVAGREEVSFTIDVRAKGQSQMVTSTLYLVLESMS